MNSQIDSEPRTQTVPGPLPVDPDQTPILLPVDPDQTPILLPVDHEQTSIPLPVDHKQIDIDPIWKPKSALERIHKVATLGSCFARHLGPALTERGYKWFDAEPVPSIFSPGVRAKYNFGVFSARTGEISTIAALRQWISWAIGAEAPADEIWQEGARFFDPFRPSIEPAGFAGPDELFASRDSALRALRKVVEHADRIVISLSDTTAWTRSSTGHVYPNPPGTFARNVRSGDYCLKSFSLAEIGADMTWIVKTISGMNTKARFLFSVSAAPLTTDECGSPSIVDTRSAKAVLRSAARMAAARHALADYFPSYEIITGVRSGVGSSPGVEAAIDYFFSNLNSTAPGAKVVSEAPIADDPVRPPATDARQFWLNVLKIRNDLRGIF